MALSTNWQRNGFVFGPMQLLQTLNSTLCGVGGTHVQYISDISSARCAHGGHARSGVRGTAWPARLAEGCCDHWPDILVAPWHPHRCSHSRVLIPFSHLESLSARAVACRTPQAVGQYRIDPPLSRKMRCILTFRGVLITKSHESPATSVSARGN